MTFAIWAIPSEPSLSRLQSIINRLASEMNTPSFLPHVTMFIGETEQAELITRFTTVVDQLPLLLSPCTRVDGDDFIFKFLYMQLQKNDALISGNSRFATLDANSDYAFNPHLSLAYNDNIMCAKQESINALNLELEGLEIEIDRYQLIRSGDIRPCLQSIATWDVIADQKIDVM
ncbi:hypothetical protein M9194_04235 [Vibrio sp. S4M6]|uniref:hypothetical protein n=1 Tax=Vibrio sinus TaxID=2946865 RepID=UPI00202AABEF|nr:hypothetical protein [Vibrio sinus]MCL9780644.1 hypothetical protein [Vibrio sinus]